MTYGYPYDQEANALWEEYASELTGTPTEPEDPTDIDIDLYLV